MKAQRRGTRIAMSHEERDAFLSSERTCRVASVGGDGAPHVAPLWYVWDGSALWLNSLVQAQRWTDVVRDPRVSVVIDAGEDYTELRGVELAGRVAPVADVPRGTEPDAEVAEAERLFGNKYSGGTFYADGRHAWLRLLPEKIVSWDFRKFGG